MNTETVKEKLSYLKLSLLHPFDGFYETRFRGKGSVPLATLLLVLYGVVQCARYQYTGFIMNTNPLYEMNSISIFISSIAIIVLAIVSNWTVTSLFNGKGNMAGIYTVVCYSLVPLIAMQIVVVILSNFITEDEVMLVRMLQGVGVVWFVFLVVSGLCVIHEYGLFKNLAALAATFIAALLIIFLLVLFLSLEEKMFSFIVSVAKEIIRRFTL